MQEKISFCDKLSRPSWNYGRGVANKESLEKAMHFTAGPEEETVM